MLLFLYEHRLVTTVNGVSLHVAPLDEAPFAREASERLDLVVHVQVVLHVADLAELLAAVLVLAEQDLVRLPALRVHLLDFVVLAKPLNFEHRGPLVVSGTFVQEVFIVGVTGVRVLTPGGQQAR